MAKRLLTGNEAFAHAALEAGVAVVAGFPGSPVTDLVETVARQCAKGRAHGVYAEWSTSAAAALEVAAAASMSGLRAMFVGKQSAFAEAADALSTLAYVGVRGGLVLFAVDDPGAHSSQTEQDTRSFAQFAHLPVLDAATPEQGCEMIATAFELSEANDLPVIVRATTRICLESAFFDVVDETRAAKAKSAPAGSRASSRGPVDGARFVHDASRWLALPDRAVAGHWHLSQHLRDIGRSYIYDDASAAFNPVYESGLPAPEEFDGYVDGAVLGIVAGGDSVQYVHEALSILGRAAASAGMPFPKVRFMQVGTTYPFPRRSVSRFLKGLEDVLVYEELDPYIENELLKLAGTRFLSPTVHGKLTGETAECGENTSEDALIRIAQFLDKCLKGDGKKGGPGQAGGAAAGGPVGGMAGAGGGAPARQTNFMQLVEWYVGSEICYEYPEKLPKRQPRLCAGCPHRGSFYAVKNAFNTLGISRNSAVLCGDVGCCELGVGEPLDSVDVLGALGSSAAVAGGFDAAWRLGNGLNVRADAPDESGDEPGPAVEEQKSVAFIGDTALLAGGLPGVLNAAYNDHDVTLVVLENSTTAMPGPVPNATSGKALTGEKAKAVNTERLLRALGAKVVHRADPLDPIKAEEALVKALLTPGFSAVVMDSPCALTKHTDTVAVVNPNKCTGCKKCIVELGCPAISFDPDARGAKSGRRGQAVIDLSQCNGCGLCTKVCPFAAIRVFDRKTAPDMSRRIAPDRGTRAAKFAESEKAADFASAAATAATTGAPPEVVSVELSVEEREGSDARAAQAAATQAAPKQANQAPGPSAQAKAAGGASSVRITRSGNVTRKTATNRVEPRQAGDENPAPGPTPEPISETVEMQFGSGLFIELDDGEEK